MRKKELLIVISTLFHFFPSGNVVSGNRFSNFHLHAEESLDVSALVQVQKFNI